MKKALFTLAVFFVLSVCVCASSYFTIMNIQEIDYGNHKRLEFSMNISDMYPYYNQGVIRVYWQPSPYHIGTEFPQFAFMSLYRPVMYQGGISWDRIFWTVKPEGLCGDWNLRVDIEDTDGAVIAKTPEFTWNFGHIERRLPYIFWISQMDVWTSFVFTNYSTEPQDVIIDLYVSGSVDPVRTKTLQLSPRESRAGYYNQLPGFSDLNYFVGYAVIRAPQDVEIMTGYDVNGLISYLPLN